MAALGAPSFAAAGLVTAAAEAITSLPVIIEGRCTRSIDGVGSPSNIGKASESELCLL
jgi:hypothetical protein